LAALQSDYRIGTPFSLDVEAYGILPKFDHPSNIQTSSHPNTTRIIKLDMFLDVLAKLQKATNSCVMSVCPSVGREQLGSRWTDFYEM